MRGQKEPNTLVILLQALVGKHVTVDLRNEVELRGRLDKVEKDMSLKMTEVTYRALQGTVTQYEQMYINGKQVRYVHIPDSVDVGQVLDRYHARMEALKKRGRQQKKRAVMKKK